MTLFINTSETFSSSMLHLPYSVKFIKEFKAMLFMHKECERLVLIKSIKQIT